MYMILSKTLGILADPVVIALVILVTGVILTLVFRKRPRMPAAFLACGFLSLLILSSPITAHFLMRGLEGRYLPLPRYGEASAVVLLGGFTSGKIPPRIHVETNHSANRVFNAVRVWRQSGAPVLVLTGGIVEITGNEVVSEAQSMFELVNEFFGVETGDVIIENRSRNTRENAVYTKTAMEEAGLGADIILVTSAYHMPRSAAVFRKAGFKVTPAPTGYFQNDFISDKPLNWLPGASALFVSSIALREYFGMAAYKVKGWI